MVCLLLAIPFGFSQIKKTKFGYCIPLYGESSNQGFFLKNGGYYFAINDYVDLSIIGDIYTKGSWNIKLNLITRKNIVFMGIKFKLFKLKKW